MIRHNDNSFLTLLMNAGAYMECGKCKKIVVYDESQACNKCQPKGESGERTS